MNYYEEREKKNEEFVVCFSWFVCLVAIGVAVFAFGLWFVKAIAPLFN